MNENCSISPRSVLFNIKPIGLGTEMVESLTSYITRLAYEHNTTVGHLVNKLLVPTMDKDYLIRSSDFGGNRFYEGARTLNGYLENSYDVVKALEVLTTRNDLQMLTLLRWKNVIPLRGLFKKYLSWCPYCVMEWIQNKKTVYYPLIWYFKIVNKCSKHSCLLMDTCPNCNRKQDILRRDSIIGLCQHCKEPLSKRTIIHTRSHENEEWQDFVNGNIGLILANQKEEPILRTYLVQHLNLINDEIFEGSLTNFGKQLNFSKGSVSGWLKGEFTPTLENQLYICQRLSINIEQLFFNEVDFSKVRLVEDGESKETVLYEYRKKFDYHFVQRQLKEILQDGEPISMGAAAKEIGINKRTLYIHFNDLCLHISNKYKQYLEEKKHQRIQDLKELIEEQFMSLLQQGIYPSRRKMESHLNKPGVLKERLLQKHWKDLLMKHEHTL